MKLFLFLFSAVTLCSCSTSYKITHQYFETHSKNVKMDSLKEYSYEDSTVRISYNLWASGGAINYRVQNKTDHPIYIDWQRSNIIFNGHSYPYWSNKTTISTSSTTNGIGNTLGNSTTNYSQVENGIITKNYSSVAGFTSVTNTATQINTEVQSTQIPPQSFTTVHKFNINYPFVTISDTQATFSKSTSPLVFRNYIAISTDAEFKNVSYVDNDFWVSKFTSYTKKGETPVEDIGKMNPYNFYIYRKEQVEEGMTNKQGCLLAGGVVGVIIITIVSGL